MPTPWYKKVAGVFRRKEYGSSEVTGGLELLSKLVSPELSKTTLIEKYKKSLYVFACVNKIALKASSVPINLYRVMNSKGEMKEVETHPILDLLYKVNPFQTKSEFLEITFINMKTTGEAFWFKVRNDRGMVIELWNLRPDKMTVIADPTDFIKGYEMSKNDGSKVKFEPDEIIHFKYPDPLNQYYGMSPLKAAQKRVLTEEYATKWQADFFLNSARPDGLIKNTNSTLTAEQKEDIRESWGKRHGGLNNSYKVAILEGGLEYQLISLSQREMDYIESLKFTRDDILVAFQVPKPIVAIVDDVNRANSETAMYIFLSETIKPEVDRLWEKVNEQLVSLDFGEEFMIEAEDPTPANREMKLKEYESGIKNRYMLINEVRAEEGMPPIKGGWSIYGTLAETPIGGLTGAEQKSFFKRMDKEAVENERIVTAHLKEKNKKVFSFKGKFWLKQKFVIYEEVVKSLQEPFMNRKKGLKKKETKTSFLKERETKTAYYTLVNKKIDKQTDNLKEASVKFFAKQGERVLKALEKKKPKDQKKYAKIEAVKGISVESIFKKDKEIALTAKFVLPYIEQYLKESAQEALNLVAPQEELDDTKKRIQKFIEKRANMFAESVNSTTLEKLDKTLSEGIANAEGIKDLMDRVESVYEEFPLYRCEMIARTEATAANGQGALEGFKQSDVANAKEWINSGDDKVRPEHQDGVGVGGEIVKLNDDFSNGLMYPEEVNCRCVLGPAFVEE